MVTIPATHRDVGECLSTTLAIEKKNNTACFLKLMSSIRFLARQGLAIRGDGISEPDSIGGSSIGAQGARAPPPFWLAMYINYCSIVQEYIGLTSVE